MEAFYKRGGCRCKRKSKSQRRLSLAPDKTYQGIVPGASRQFAHCKYENTPHFCEVILL
jgi:hypothetical protein